MSGDGGLFRRKSDGMWVAQVTSGGRENRKVIRRYRKRKSDAKAELAKLLATSGRVDRKTTVGAYLTAWLEGPGRDVLKASTWQTYELTLRLHLIPALGHLPLAALTPEHVEQMVGKLRRRMTAKGVRNVLSVLGRVLAIAERRRQIVANPVRFVELPRQERTAGPAALTPDDARKIRQAIAGDRLEALYVVTLACGLRQAEVLGLRWQDVDLDAAVLRVEGTLDRVAGKYVMVEPKTRRSRRTLALPAFAVTALYEHRARQLIERIQAGVPTEDGLVFVSPSGRPINGGWLSHRWRRLTRAAGLDLRFHDLRHSQASLLIAAGVHPRVVMERLGHATIDMSMTTYGHVGSAQDRDAADQLDKAIGGSR
jgi:integrase